MSFGGTFKKLNKQERKHIFKLWGMNRLSQPAPQADSNTFVHTEGPSWQGQPFENYSLQMPPFLFLSLLSNKKINKEKEEEEGDKDLYTAMWVLLSQFVLKLQ